MDIKMRQTTISPKDTESRMVMVARVSFVSSETKKERFSFENSRLKHCEVYT